LVSFVIDMEDGKAIETTLVGREGAVGGIVSQGRLPAYSRIMVQFGGDFVTLPLSVLESAKLKSRSLDALFARYADCMVAQIFQATACNAAHTIEQRACKWINAAMERTNSQEVPLTQDRLSAMLGVGRSYISRVIKTLKSDKVLKVKRGKIVIEDRQALVDRACKCNDSVKDHFKLVLSGVYPADNEA
jgi:Crp-like helix-turn-helix domain